MDNCLNKACLKKIEDAVLIVVSMAGLILMILHWR